MTIEFTRNDRPTIGVEMELDVVDATTGALVSASNELLAELGRGHPGGEHPKAKHELFQSTVEVITGVCETPAEAGDDLRASIAELRAACTPRGLSLISAGTHPFSLAREQVLSPQQRYHDLVEAMQWPARRLLICGLHVHVGVRDGSRAIAIINELRRHLPVFLALSSSSPYFEGEDSGLASARSKVFESLPTAGLPPLLADWNDFEAFMSTLIESRCISSIREVWWDVRPHPDFGTIEFRMCDATPTVRESVAIAGLAQTLVSWCDQRIDETGLPEPAREWTVRENRWLAARVRARRRADRRGSRAGAPTAGARAGRRTDRHARADRRSPRHLGPARRPGHGARDRLRGAAPTEGRRARRYARRRGEPPRRQPRHRHHRLMAATAPSDPAPAGASLDRWLAEHGEGLVALRRTMHAHPELSGEEHATTELVAERLVLAGLHPRRLAVGTGLVCDLDPPGAADRPRLALRADLDALAMADEKDVPYASRVPGVAHACGHDVHTTVVLGAALYFAHHLDELPGPLRVVFQPAEERVPGGALDVLADGGMDGIDAVVGLHCEPKLDVGSIGLRAGAISSAADMAVITLSGPGGHTARPELTVDLVTVAARVVAELPGRVAAHLDDPGDVKLVFGAIHAGDAANVIPTHCELKASIRTPSLSVWEQLTDLVTRELAAIIEPTGAQMVLDYTHGVPPVVNDADVTATVRLAATNAVGAGSVVEAAQSWGGDDFAWFTRAVPGTYVRLGVRTPDGPTLDLHAGHFDVDERAIDLAVRLLVETVREFHGATTEP